MQSSWVRDAAPYYDIDVRETTYSVLVTPIQVHNATSQTSTLKNELKLAQAAAQGGL